MTEFWQFMGEHWFIAWCFSWTVWGMIWLVLHVWICALRTIKVCLRGWPPPHLDADGDWKPEPEPEQES